MAKKKMYVVSVLVPKMKVGVVGTPFTQDCFFKDYAEGCIGVMMVFSGKKAAQKYRRTLMEKGAKGPLSEILEVNLL